MLGQNVNDKIGEWIFGEITTTQNQTPRLTATQILQLTATQIPHIIMLTVVRLEFNHTTKLSKNTQ
jgi:hypothetical protein